MHEYTSIIMNSLHLFLIFCLDVYMLFWFSLIKGSLWRRVKGAGVGVGVVFFKKWMKTSRGKAGQTYLYVHSVKKITWFFKQQIEFFLISCLDVCVKNMVIFYVEFKNNNSFLSFHSPIFISIWNFFWGVR